MPNWVSVHPFFEKILIQEIQRINERELEMNVSTEASWHNKYLQSAYIYIGSLDHELNEGDIIQVFSQFGEVVDCYLVRDKETGNSRGYAFLAYEDQRNRHLHVDHVSRYRKPLSHTGKDKKPKKTDNMEWEASEDDESYEKRRRQIWNYELYEQHNEEKEKEYNKKEKEKEVENTHSKIKMEMEQKLTERKMKRQNDRAK
ncbi:RNA-binding region RNP-1 domain-containing protein [Reticulomyxa filosa]|uniref:RNA-binding region RNP-1 domain-containing protein n=1 Tax=Reticulomyxa filosa TaxID=46433 RepID=X6LBW4_RETFI|nr:RNA-binding region RNP-1 domain-containing protein [Reticulomyxa filosa]|eukprot:ETN99497.1 RNA-binding region RNP-1 domain-containing protein [Reticulomyxa filosa]